MKNTEQLIGNSSNYNKSIGEKLYYMLQCSSSTEKKPRFYSSLMTRFHILWNSHNDTKELVKECASCNLSLRHDFSTFKDFFENVGNSAPLKTLKTYKAKIKNSGVEVGVLHRVIEP